MGKTISGSYTKRNKKEPEQEQVAPLPPEPAVEEIELEGEWVPEWDKEDEEPETEEIEA